MQARPALALRALEGGLPLECSCASLPNLKEDSSVRSAPLRSGETRETSSLNWCADAETEGITRSRPRARGGDASSCTTAKASRTLRAAACRASVSLSLFSSQKRTSLRAHTRLFFPHSDENPRLSRVFQKVSLSLSLSLDSNHLSLVCRSHSQRARATTKTELRAPGSRGVELAADDLRPRRQAAICIVFFKRGISAGRSLRFGSDS